ncbi:hypothetical protein AUI46_02365 [archaeon 13_1_40CM_2_52_13]|nr:MAG: hypothetical protein AUI46_02365 [archaeon 13_1_40CM_2_52_13]OLE71430.1 MAG: hypothetical protein AUF78_02210 [archaeon 13_1_20CM_2_51_12]TMI40770.1 MAG: hypothetical protein E6H21_05585 [Candidatus Bathyarchaeota archaeon]
MADAVFLVLLLVHVGSIVAWMGGATLFVSVLSPALRRMSPASRGEFVLSVLPSYMRFIGGSSIAAAVAGLALYAYITQVATSLAPSSSGLIYVQVGAVVTLIVLLIAFGVLIPTSRKLVGLLKQSQKQSVPGGDATIGAQVGNLQKRLGMAARLGVFLLAVTFILMIVGASI